MALYLDHNATTPLDGRVLEAMLPFLREHHGNPNSLHASGQLARRAIEQAREQVAALAGAHPSQVVFTSGGTEANNLALAGVLEALGKGARLAVSAVEHPSVLEMARRLEGCGFALSLLPVDGQGRVEPETRLPKGGAGLVSVMMANNETGVIQPVEALAARARERGWLFHTDAVQAAGKMALDFHRLGADLMTLSAHKIHGPKGIGALVVGAGVDLVPQLVGGGQEKGRRSGTENVAAIVGFGRAAELALQEREARAARMLALRQRLEAALEGIEGATLFGREAPRLPNTLFFAVPGIDGETLLLALDRAGIELSSGAACDSNKDRASHVLLAMGVAPELARCALRVSLGRDNTEDDIDHFVSVLQREIHTLRSMASLAWA